MARTSLPFEERMRHAKAQIESDMSQEKYAEQLGLPASTIGYWVKQYHDKFGGARPRAKRGGGDTVTPHIANGKALVRDELGDARAEVLALLSVRDELLAKLEDAHTKIDSLQNVVIVLGHQVGDR
jgi:transposase-like protein